MGQLPVELLRCYRIVGPRTMRFHSKIDQYFPIAYAIHPGVNDVAAVYGVGLEALRDGYQPLGPVTLRCGARHLLGRLGSPTCSLLWLGQGVVWFDREGVVVALGPSGRRSSPPTFCMTVHRGSDLEGGKRRRPAARTLPSRLLHKSVR